MHSQAFSQLTDEKGEKMGRESFRARSLPFVFGDEFSPFCGKYLCKILFTQNSLFKNKFAKNP
jgi:hypothetical protein